VDQPLGHGGDRTNPVIYDGGVNSDNPPAIAPGATVHCSLIDLMRYVTLHLRGAREEPTLLLTSPTFTALHSDAFGFDYGMGWGIANRTWAGGDALTHAGSNTQWLTNIWIAPEVNWAVVVCINFGGTDAFASSDTVVGHAISNHGP
jgi:CubicO group peptidase (beta-lactamase class C family)